MDRALFSPIKIGNLTVKNRVVLAPMDTELTAPDGGVTDRYVAFLRERAVGGAGLVLTEFSAVDEAQMMSSLGSYSGRLVAGLNRLVEAIEPFGSRIFLQLAHHGGQALTSMTGKRPVAPSEIDSPIYTHRPRALERDEVLALIGRFVEAAQRSQQAGFHGVEVHAAYDYLIGQFVSPHCNRRQDDFGRSFDGRMRFPGAVIEGIRRACGAEYPIGFKFSACEALPGGLTLEEGQRVATWAESQGVAYVHVAVTSSRVELTNLSTLYSTSAQHEEIGRTIRKTVKVPVILTACCRTPDEAERLLEAGMCDLVAVGRPFLADPHWARKAQARQLERPCILCNRCHQRIMTSREIRCTVNPSLGTDEGRPARLAPKAKQVVIVGAGPAGMSAALAAAERGHHVALFEQRDTVGGNLALAASHDFKQPVKELLAYFQERLGAAPIDVHLGTAFTADRLKEPPDVLVIAVGATPIVPQIPGIPAAHAAQATDRAILEASLSGPVVVAGAGLVGLETALHLARNGLSVSVIEKRDREAAFRGEATYIRDHLFARLEALGVSLLFEHELARVERDTILCRVGDGAKCKALPCRALVLALGSAPSRTLLEEVAPHARDVEVLAVGDCSQTGNLYTAIHDGHEMGSRI